MSHPITNRKWADSALFLCHTVSSIMFHPMTIRQWVTLLYFIASQSYQSCLTPWPTECEWHCFISLPTTSDTIIHDHQIVSLMKLSSKQYHCFSYCCQQSVSDKSSFLSLLFISQTVCEWECICFSSDNFTLSPWHDPMMTNSKCVIQLLMDHAVIS